MNYIEVFAAAFSTLFFGIIFNLTGRKLIYSSFAGGLGWYTYLLLYKEMGYSKTAAYLFSAIVITAFSEIIKENNCNNYTNSSTYSSCSRWRNLLYYVILC